MEEIWKPIPKWGGMYEVSNLGRVKSLERITKFGKRIKIYPETILKQSIGKRGYYVVSFFKNGHGTTKTVHRLVAEAFIPNPENKPCIDHIDGDRTNNSIANLRWCTYKENANNPISLKRMSMATKSLWEKCSFEGRNNLTYRSVAQLSKEGKIINVFNSIKEASDATGIDSSSITCVCKKRNKNRHTAGGFIWKYVNNKREKKDA